MLLVPVVVALVDQGRFDVDRVGNAEAPVRRVGHVYVVQKTGRLEVRLGSTDVVRRNGSLSSRPEVKVSDLLDDPKGIFVQFCRFVLAGVGRVRPNSDGACH